MWKETANNIKIAISIDLKLNSLAMNPAEMSNYCYDLSLY